MKRSLSLLICMALLFGCALPAEAAYTREDWYEMGLKALAEMTPEMLPQAVSSFEAAGSFGLARHYKQYSQALCDILSLESGDTDPDTIIWRLETLAGKADFTTDLAGRQYPPCSQLIGYIEARRLEAAGDAAGAWHLYSENDILDAMDRQAALLSDVYEQAKRYLDEGRYAEAAAALEGFRFKDSEELRRQAIALMPTPTPKPTPVPTPVPTLKPTSVPTPVPTPQSTLVPTLQPTPKPTLTPIAKCQTGDIVTFGHYEQDNNLSNGQEGIEWIVLDRVGKKVLLISKYILDAKPYNTRYKDVTWETCTLRAWLNDDFLNAAFTVREQKGIVLTTVDNGSNQGSSKWNTYGGNNTKDKIFLLSCAEVYKYFGVTVEDNSSMKSRAAPTVYADMAGVFTSFDAITVENDEAGSWWLRSPGSDQRRAEAVASYGAIRDFGAIWDYLSVRPALWIDLESGIF